MTGVEIYSFIKPHLGNIDASGNHSLDMERIKNFKIYDELINCLLEDLDQSFNGSRDRYEDSMKKINAKAKDVMLDKAEWLNNYPFEEKL